MFNNILLSPDVLEMFSKSFSDKLQNYKLSYYIRGKDNCSQENAIHSAILWSRESVLQINNSKLFVGSKNVNDLFLFIHYIDILLEATDQVYRVLYNSKSSYPDEEMLIFHDVPLQYCDLKNRQYFKQIRAMFGAHPVNLSDPDKTKRFADVPRAHRKIDNIAGRKGDFIIRTWTATKNDKDTIHFPLHINDLTDYAQKIYDRFSNFTDRLTKIANKKV